MSDFKFDLRLQMPQRQYEHPEEECEYCGQVHAKEEQCEGTGYDSHLPPAYSVPQVESSNYLKAALKRFKEKQKAKKNAKS